MIILVLPSEGYTIEVNEKNNEEIYVFCCLCSSGAMLLTNDMPFCVNHTRQFIGIQNWELFDNTMKQLPRLTDF